MSLRPIKPITENKPLKRKPMDPPPKIAWLSLDQLVVDEEYQRALSRRGEAMIRRLVENWDWNCFKPLSVAPASDGLYEVVDGQHTALAAATHGSVDMLPCLVLTAATQADRARAFVGINRDRISLTPYALYCAKLAAGDEEAEAVDAALCSSGATLHETFRSDIEYGPGAVTCLRTLLLIVRHGGKARLTRLLRMCIAAGIGPVPSSLLKGLADMITMPEAPTDAELVEILTDLGGDTILDMASERRRTGQARDQAGAIVQVLMSKAKPRKAAA